MQTSNRKRIIVVILAILTLFLAGVAILVGIRLTQDQAPDDAAADICCLAITCVDGSEFGGDTRAPHNNCQDRANEACIGRGGPRPGTGAACPVQPSTSSSTSSALPAACTHYSTPTSCESASSPYGCIPCGSSGTATDPVCPNVFYVSVACNQTCNDLRLNLCGNITGPIGQTCRGDGEVVGSPSQCCSGQGHVVEFGYECDGNGSNANIYQCTFEYMASRPAGSGCQQNGTPISTTITDPNNCPWPSSYCGVVQCDLANGQFQSRIYTNGCTTPTVPPPVVYVPPSSSSSSSTTTTASTTTTTSTVSTPETAAQCVELVQTSPTPNGNPATIATGQTVLFTGQYTCPGLNNNLRLAVLDGSNNQVGSPATVVPESSTYDSAAGTCTYTFQWTATGVANGTYNVRMLLNGTTASIVTSPTACTKAVTVSSSETVEPVISVVKSGALVCTPDGAHTNYTITVSNTGTVAAYITTVRDNLPSGVDGTSTTRITNIVPTAGLSRTSTYLEWAVNSSLSAGSDLTYSYRINYNTTQLAAVTGGVENNSVTTTYGPGDEGAGGATSTYTFENAVNITACSSLPATGLFDGDSAPLLLGLALIAAGIMANRSQFFFKRLGLNSGEEYFAEGMVDYLAGTYSDKVEKSFKKKASRK